MHQNRYGIKILKKSYKFHCNFVQILVDCDITLEMKGSDKIIDN